jgi:butyrate kinase
VNHYRILAVNPGSTSTKMAVFVDEQQEVAETLRHPADTLQQFKGVWDQFEFRLSAVRQWAESHAGALSAVVGMGGLLRPLPGGTYRVNDRMLADARANLQGEHSSNLGCAIAGAIARIHRCDAFIVDPVSVDELEPLARYSGHPSIRRSSLSHALNIHAAARRAASDRGVAFETSRLVVAHLGGGISVAPVLGGRIIDVNDAASDGPFSPERTGGLPLQPFITLCCSKTLSESELRRFVMGKGGLVAYLGTNAAVEVEERIDRGDQTAREVYEAMAYQIAKEIGSMATVLRGEVDAIVLTGGLASSPLLVRWISERVRTIATVLVYPGEDEMRSLALGAVRVLRGESAPLDY